MCRNIGTRRFMKNAERELASALATAVILRLAKCWQIIKRRAEASLNETANLSLREFWILLAASSNAPVSQKQIASHLGLNQNVIVLLLDRLENSGHVRRSRNPENRREQFVGLTSKGKAVVRSVLADQAKRHRAILAPLSDDRIKTVFDAAQSILSFESDTSGKKGRSKIAAAKRAV